MASSPDFSSPLSPLNLSPNSFPSHYDENTCYYVVLGLDKASRPSQDEIKKAYKKTALRFHPDKNAQESLEVRKVAEKLFKLVSRAYEVLSNEKLKSLYDRAGHRGINSMNGQEDDEDILRASQRHNRSTRRDTFGQHPMFGPSSPHTRGGFTGFADPFEIFQSVFGAMHAHHANTFGSSQRGGGFHGSPLSPFAAGSPFSGGGGASRQHSSAFDAYNVDGGDADRRTGANSNKNRSQHQSSNDHSRRQSPQSYHASPHDPFFGAHDPFANMGMGMGFGFGMGGGMMNSMMAQHHQMMNMMDGVSSMSSTVRSGGGGGAGGSFTSSSTSTTTRIVNGQRVTRTVRRTTDANGNTTEDVSEHAEPLAIGQGSGGQGGSRGMHIVW